VGGGGNSRKTGYGGGPRSLKGEGDFTEKGKNLGGGEERWISRRGRG